MIPTAWRRLRVERTAELRPPAKTVLWVNLIPGLLNVHERDGWLTLTAWVEQTVAYVTPQGQAVTRKDSFPCGVALPGRFTPAGPARWRVQVEGSSFWLEPGPGQEGGARLELEWELVFGPELEPPASEPAAGGAVEGEFVTIWAECVQGRQRSRLVVPVTAVLPSPLLRLAARHDRVDGGECEVIGRAVLVRGAVTSTFEYEAPGGVMANHAHVESFAHLMETGQGGRAAEVSGRVLAGSPLRVDGDGSRVTGWHVVELEAVVLDQGPLRVLTAGPGGVSAVAGTVARVQRLAGAGRAVGMVELTGSLVPPGNQLLGVQRRVVLGSCQVLLGKVMVTGRVHSHFRYAGADGIQRYAQVQGQATLAVAIPEAAPGMEAHCALSVGSGQERLAPGGMEVVDEVVLEVAVHALSTCSLPLVTRTLGGASGTGSALVRVAIPVPTARGSLLQHCLVELERPVRQWVRGEVEAAGVSARALDGQVLCEGVLAINVYYVDYEGYEQYRGQAEPFCSMVVVPGCRAGMRARVRVLPELEPVPAAGGLLTLRVAAELLVEAWEVRELEVVTAG